MLKVAFVVWQNEAVTVKPLEGLPVRGRDPRSFRPRSALVTLASASTVASSTASACRKAGAAQHRQQPEPLSQPAAKRRVGC